MDKYDILDELRILDKTPRNSGRANELLDIATDIWRTNGYSGLKSNTNSRWFSEIMAEHSRFPQLM